VTHPYSKPFKLPLKQGMCAFATSIKGLVRVEADIQEAVTVKYNEGGAFIIALKNKEVRSSSAGTHRCRQNSLKVGVVGSENRKGLVEVIFQKGHLIHGNRQRKG